MQSTSNPVSYTHLRMVETLRQETHVVIATYGYTHTQLAIAPLFDAVLQGFQSARQTAHNRIRCQCHRHGHQTQRPEKAKRRAPARLRWPWQMHVDGLAVAHMNIKFRAFAITSMDFRIRRWPARWESAWAGTGWPRP